MCLSAAVHFQDAFQASRHYQHLSSFPSRRGRCFYTIMSQRWIPSARRVSVMSFGASSPNKQSFALDVVHTRGGGQLLFSQKCQCQGELSSSDLHGGRSSIWPVLECPTGRAARNAASHCQLLGVGEREVPSSAPSRFSSAALLLLSAATVSKGSVLEAVCSQPSTPLLHPPCSRCLLLSRCAVFKTILVSKFPARLSRQFCSLS